MAYDEQLADRVRAELGTRADFEERRMFGGLAFMVNTHMACGLIRDDLMVRVGKQNYDAALARGAEPMEMGGRQMRGMVRIPGHTVADGAGLSAWLDEAVAFAQAEPPKPAKKATKPARRRE